jgi:hypothetical protein
MLLLETGAVTQRPYGCWIRNASRGGRRAVFSIQHRLAGRRATLTSVSSPGIADFLARLSARDQAAAWLAGELLEAGWSVRRLDGPLQMDVWQLLLDRGACSVRFGMERGRSDGVHVADRADGFRPLAEAMAGSAQGGTLLAEDPTAVFHWLTQQSGHAAP